MAINQESSVVAKLRDECAEALAKKEAGIMRLREALTFYADPATYKEFPMWEQAPLRPDIDDDMGERARAALGRGEAE